MASSVIASIAYDLKTEKLTVNFVRGGSHVYDGVPETVAQAFKNDPSGGFFNRNIRNSY